MKCNRFAISVEHIFDLNITIKIHIKLTVNILCYADRASRYNLCK